VTAFTLSSGMSSSRSPNGTKARSDHLTSALTEPQETVHPTLATATIMVHDDAHLCTPKDQRRQ
jgi:hypothetical protein